MSNKHTTIQNGETLRSTQIFSVGFQNEKMKILFVVSYVVFYLLDWALRRVY